MCPVKGGRMTSDASVSSGDDSGGGSLWSMEDAPFTRFHAYMTWCTAGGPLCDGYILGIIALALTPMVDDLGLSTTMTAAVAASSLVGLFFGALIFGRVTDLVGRRTMYIINLVSFVVASVLLLFVVAGWQVLLLRFVLGLAVGADYAIATALLAEFLPRRQRGTALATLLGGFWAGYTISFIIGYVMIDVGGLGWRWALASSAVPAILVLALRAKAPESPMWLAQRGRRAEARAIVRDRIGPEYTLPEVPPEEGQRMEWHAIFRSGYGRRLFFIAAFWACQVADQYAVFTFQPRLLDTLGISNENLGTVLISLFFVAGVVPFIFLVGSWGRRPVLLVTFIVGAAILALLGAFPAMPAALIIIGFGLFGVCNAGGSVLQWVYPNELFPTGIRATAVGFGAGMSRIGAAAGTYVVPFLFEEGGASVVLWIFSGVALLGFLISLPLAPETKHMRIAESSGTTHSER